MTPVTVSDKILEILKPLIKSGEIEHFDIDLGFPGVSITSSFSVHGYRANGKARKRRVGPK